MVLEMSDIATSPALQTLTGIVKGHNTDYFGIRVEYPHMEIVYVSVLLSRVKFVYSDPSRL